MSSFVLAGVPPSHASVHVCPPTRVSPLLYVVPVTSCIWQPTQEFETAVRCRDLGMPLMTAFVT